MAESESGFSGISNDHLLEDINELSNEELQQKTHEALRWNELLTNETDMFESFLRRVDPKDLLSGSLAPPTTNVGAGLEGRRRRSKSRSSSTDRLAKLTAEQKLDIAQREYDELLDEKARLEEEAEKNIDTENAVLAEAEIALDELNRAQREFEREVKNSVNVRTGKVLAEKVTRHFDEKIRAKETLIEKTRLKNNSLKANVKKLKTQLKQKEEMGEVLNEVDFKQLQIENEQYVSKIDDKNKELLRLKLMAGNTMQVLNKYKKKLSVISDENGKLQEELTQRNDMCGRIDLESVTVEDEQQKAYAENQKLRLQLEDFKVPEVIEYVKDKAQLSTLRSEVTSWERKVEIAEMSLKTHHKTWNKLKNATKPSEMPWKQLIQGNS